jgi:TonB family protein
MAAGAAFSAENLPNAPPSPEVIPSRRANKFLIHNQTPAYPPIARMNYIQGRVSVQTLVDGSGEVKEAHVVKGHPFLAVAALKAIQNWLFKPALSRQGPASFLTYVDVNFSLQSRRFAAYPPRPEADLIRQVQPPELEEKLPEKGNSKTVRMRILVGPDGRVMDSVSPSASGRDLTDARQVLAHWTSGRRDGAQLPYPGIWRSTFPSTFGPPRCRVLPPLTHNRVGPTPLSSPCI